MPTLRDLVPGYDPTLATLVPGSGPSPVQQGLRGPATAAIEDQAAANGMGQLRKGFASGRLNTERNYLLAEESRMRAAGRAPEADELRGRIEALQGRAATFAPAEQDVTQLQWNPGRILDYGLGAMGQGTASMVDPVALGVGANAAAGVVGMVPRPMAKPIAGALRLGGMAGGYGLNALQGKGEFYGEAVQNPEIMRTKSAQEIDTAGNVSGAVSGALDSVLTGSVAGRIAGRPGMKALAGLGTLPKIGLDVAGEAVTETAQGEVKRGTLSHLDPTRDTSGDTAARWNDAAGGAFGAGPMSVASHMASKGHARLAVPDDTSSDDVSGKAKAPGAAPKNEPLSKAVLRSAKGHDDDAASEAWNEVLSGSHSPDLDTATTEQHAALMKELGGRAAKGDATAQQHLETLQAMDPNDPTGWYDEAPRKAAYDHILGDGKDHEKVRAAYRDRKLNAQGQDDTHTALATGLLKAALPNDAHGLDAAIADLGRDLGKLAKAPKGRVSIANAGRMWDTAGRMVELYGFEGAKAAIAKVGMALGVEKTEMFKSLQSQLVGANFLQAKKNRRVSRTDAATKLFAIIPAEARLKLFGEGVDLTQASTQLGLLDTIEQTAKAIGWGAVDDKGKPIEVKPSAYAKLTSRLGGDAARAALDLVSPGKVEEREDVGTPKRGASGKTEAAGIGSDDNEFKPAVGAEAGADRELDGALRNIDKAPGSKLYSFNKKHHVTSSTKPGEHPFVFDKKLKSLPSLVTADQTDKETGFNTLERMAEQLYTKLGGDPFKNIVSVMQRGAASKDHYGMSRRRIVRENLKQGDIKNDDPAAAVSAFGIGSYRIRTVSAKDVMDDREVPAPTRVKLMTEYLHQDGTADKNLGLIKSMSVLDRRIKAADTTEKKEALTDERRTMLATMAQAVGMKDYDSSTLTLADVADAYFSDRFLVAAEQMAEKDQLRLDQAEVVRMIQRGNKDIQFSQQGRENGTELPTQADMNLIRFKSDFAVAKTGIAAVRAGDLVAWVFQNRNDFTKKEGSAEVRALDYRNALMEGIGALAADGYMSEMPYMQDEQGKRQEFGGKRGFPPVLKLGRITQADLTRTAEQRVKAKIIELRETRSFEESRTPEERAKAAERVEQARQLRVARDQDKSEEVKNTDPTELLDQGKEAKRKEVDTDELPFGPRLKPLGGQPDLPGVKPAEFPLGARYWDAPAGAGTDEARLAAVNANADAVKNPEVDPFTGEAKKPKVRRVSSTATAPETQETRRDDDERTQLDWDMTESEGAVPTDFVDVRNSTSVLNSARDKPLTLTPVTAMRDGAKMAEKLWGQFMDNRAEALAGLRRLVATAERPAYPADGGYAGGPQYAAPAAMLLTPERAKTLVASSQGPERAARILEGLRQRTAAALQAAEGVLPLHQRITLARALIGNDKLTGFTMKAALEALAAPVKTVVAKPEPAPAKPVKADTGSRYNSMAVKIHTDLERMGFAATHDSPTRHEGKFDWRAHIGKGEGNAAFGAGTYLSTAEGTHKGYKKQFTAKVEREAPPTAEMRQLREAVDANSEIVMDLMQERDVGGPWRISIGGRVDHFDTREEAQDAIDAHRQSRVARIAELKKMLVDKVNPEGKEYNLNYIRNEALPYVEEKLRGEDRLASKPENLQELIDKATDEGRELLRRFEEAKAASPAFALKSPTYEVSVDIPQDHLLDWDKDYHEQADFVKRALDSAESTAPLIFRGDLSGGAMYREIGRQLKSRLIAQSKIREPVSRAHKGYKPVDEQTLASEYLQSLGILGHRYAAAGGKNDAHPNYVIYDDSKITTNYVHFNAQSAAQAAPTEAKIAEAKAYLTKVLGPKVKAEFSKDFGHAGEWVEAENLIRLSTAIGPGVLSVAHHEALHAFWSRAIKSHPGATEALSKVMSSPAMLERLKALLAEHPAALAAITEGPHAAEERVAYAYQFWAAGELEVDKPATTLFAKFRKFLRKVLGMVRESETALDLMTALHDGKLAEPSAAGEVIGKILKDATWNEDFKRKHDKFFQNAAAAINPSNDVLRHEKLSATARALGRTMFTNPGEESDGKFKEGYLNARSRKIRQYTNYLYAGLKGLSEKDMEAAAKHLQLKTAPEDIAYAPVRKAVVDVRALTRRYWEYATKDAGLKLEYLGDDHYPRVWSLNALIEGNGKADFIAMLMKPKYAPTMTAAMEMANDKRTTKLTKEEVAAEMYQHLIDKNGVDDKVPTGEGEGVLTPFFASQKERSFKWLDDADVEPFLEKDLVGAMSRYLHQGIRAAEYARRFGEGGEKLKEMLAMKGDEWINPETDRRESRPEHGAIAAEIVESLKAQGVTGKDADVVLARHMEDIRRSVSAHEGSLGKDITPQARKWSSAAMAYQNLRLLPLSLFAAFGDVMGIVAHGAGAKAGYEAFLQGMKDVYLRWKDAASDMPEARQKSVWEGIAEMVGAIDSRMFLEQMGKAHTSEFMTDFARKSNRALFMANGLTAWDRSMRVSATKAAVLFLQDHASLPDKQHSKRWLAELGLKPENIPLDADGKLITDRHVLAATKGIPIEQATQEMERVHQALVRWVEGAVLTPNAGQRPTWASDPHYAVLFHLKQFTYSFHHTILKRAFNEANHGNMNPFGALAAAIPTMIAADMVKGLVLGGGSLPAYMKAWDAGDWMLHGAERAGLGGVGQFGIDALSDPLGVMGPTVGQVGDFVTSPTDILHNIHNAIPGARYIKGLPDFTRATA